LGYQGPSDQSQGLLCQIKEICVVFAAEMMNGREKRVLRAWR
jgi:hypothetical protein